MISFYFAPQRQADSGPPHRQPEGLTRPHQHHTACLANRLIAANNHGSPDSRINPPPLFSARGEKMRERPLADSQLGSVL